MLSFLITEGLNSHTTRLPNSVFFGKFLNPLNKYSLLSAQSCDSSRAHDSGSFCHMYFVEDKRLDASLSQR
jgi:hypothetical protein